MDRGKTQPGGRAQTGMITVKALLKPMVTVKLALTNIAESFTNTVISGVHEP